MENVSQPNPATALEIPLLNQPTLLDRRGFCMTAGRAVALPALAMLSACGQRDTPAARLPMPPIRSSLMPAAQISTAAQAQGPALLRLHKILSTRMFGFGTGDAAAKTVVHVVFDPMCPHCGRVWVSSMPLLDRMRFIWLPVPLLGPDSMLTASLIMGSADPAKVMHAHEHNLRNSLSPLAANPDLIAKGRPAMEHNDRIAREIGLNAVPLLLTQRANGEVISTGGGIGTAEIVQFVS